MQTQDELDYAKAFRGEDVVADGDGNEVSDDAAEGQSEGGADAASMVIDAEAAVDQAADEAGMTVPEEAAAEGEPVAEEMAEQGAEPEMSPEEIQRQKSWEGRLKKREEELAAREAAMSGEPAASVAQEEVGDAEIADIRTQLAEDFGEEFVAMIGKIAAYEARKLASSGMDERINPINSAIASAIADVTEAFQSMHMSAIAEAHEDFQAIVNSPEFEAYIGGLSGDEQAAAVETINAGTPKQVIGLLNAYKAAATIKDEPVDDGIDAALDAAEGVRGNSPVQLPGRVPVGDDDEYSAAWNSM